MDEFYILDNGEQRGPFTLSQVQTMWNNGSLTSRTLYCQPGFQEWLPLATLTEACEEPAKKTALHKHSTVSFPAHGKSATRAGEPKRPGLIIALVAAAAIAFVLILSRSNTERSNDNKISASEADYINSFARKYDMTVEQVIRWRYVLSKRGLSLDDFGEAMTKLEQSAEKAVGYHVEHPKRNEGTRLITAGETWPPQDPTLTSQEESVVNLLKVAGY